MGFLDFFKTKNFNRFSTWKELGTYKSTFSSFGTDVYKSEIVRSCIRPLVDFTSKAEAKCSDPNIEKLLNTRPNLYMSGTDFLKKVRTRYEIYNTCFIYIQRGDNGKATGLYPVPYQSFEALEHMGELFIKFTFANSFAQPLTVAWQDLAIVRKDYNSSDIAGDDNLAILDTLSVLSTLNQGVANAVKATANLRGILKSTKAMLSPADIKKNKEDFVRDYLSLENEGGIASLDSTQEFIPITMNPTIASADQIKEFRQDVQRYYGVNEKIVTSDLTPEEIEAFYELKIEPFLVALSQELTSKVFTARELGFKNYIVYEANKLQFASLGKKIQIFSTVVLYGGMTVNEWRKACNMAPIEGGDELIRRLDAAAVQQEGVKDGEDE